MSMCRGCRCHEPYTVQTCPIESRHNLSQLSWRVTNIRMGKYFLLEVQELLEFAKTNNNKQVANSCLELGLLGGQIAGWQVSFWVNLHIWLAELLDGWMAGWPNGCTIDQLGTSCKVLRGPNQPRHQYHPWNVVHCTFAAPPLHYCSKPGVPLYPAGQGWLVRLSAITAIRPARVGPGTTVDPGPHPPTHWFPWLAFV